MLPWRRLFVTPRQAPVTTVLLAISIVLAVAARLPATAARTHQILALSPGQLAAGRMWTPLTALLVPGALDGFLLALLTLMFVLPHVEHAVGSRRVLVGYFALGGVAALLGVGLLAVLAHFGEPWATLSLPLLTGDPTIGVTAALMVGAGAMTPVWRTRTVVATGFATGVLFLYAGQPADLYRLISFGLGLGVLWWASWRRGETAGRVWRPSSAHEIRLVAAGLVLALGIGPMISVVSQVRLGLLSPSVILIDDTEDPGLLTCSMFKVGEQCWNWQVIGHIPHEGWTWTEMLALVLFLLAARGLMRGRRSAVVISVVLILRTLVSVVVCFTRLPPNHLTALTAATTAERVELVIEVSAVILVHVGALIWLIAVLHRFPLVPSPRETARHLCWFLAILGVAGLVLTGAVLAMRSSFAGPPSPMRAALAGLELFLPPAARSRLGGLIHPETFATRMLTGGVETALWIALAVLTWQILTAHPLIKGGPSASEIRERLRIGGGSTFSFMATWPGNRHWQDPVTGAIIAYRATAGVALTLSEPFGAPGADLVALVRRFNAFADSQGLIPAWYAVTAAAFDPVAHELQWDQLEVAQESVVAVQNWQTKGRKWQDVRTALSRAEREGIHAEWTSWADLPMEAYAQIVELSQDWVSDHPLPEMGFTLGGLDELRDPDVRLMIAYGRNHAVQGVLSWLPSWRDQRLVGWTLDFMRKRHDAMPGIMEFLIAQSAMRMKENGIEFMSLSGAPLAHDAPAASVASDSAPPSDLRHLLDDLSAALEPVYGFSSLHHFKQKFQPEVRPTLMVFASGINLPSIGLAVVRSYLPQLSLKQALSAVREMSDHST